MWSKLLALLEGGVMDGRGNHMVSRLPGSAQVVSSSHQHRPFDVIIPSDLSNRPV